MGFFDWIRGKKAARTPEAFTELALAVARERPEFANAVAHPDEFAILPNRDDSQTMYLSNVWADVNGATLDEQRDALRHYFEGLATRVELPQTWADARDGVFLALRTGGLLQVGDPVYAPVLNHLVVVLAFDLGTAITYVTSDQLDGWGVDRDTAWARARANMLDLAPDIGVVEPRALTRIMSGQIDSASYLMAPGWLAARAGGGRIVAWASGRDSLVVVRADDDVGLEQLATVACEEWEDAPRAISPVLYTVDGDGEVVPLSVAPSHEAFEALELSRYKLALREYTEQKTLLDERHDDDGTDIFVASYLVHQLESGGLRSTAVWTRDVDSLLPEADVVALLDDRTEELVEVPLPILLASVPGIERAEGLFPVRYRARAWPAPGLIEQLKARV